MVVGRPDDQSILDVGIAVKGDVNRAAGGDVAESILLFRCDITGDVDEPADVVDKITAGDLVGRAALAVFWTYLLEGEMYFDLRDRELFSIDIHSEGHRSAGTE
jgi:hypothetical protein